MLKSLILVATSFVVAAVAQEQCVPYSSNFVFTPDQYPTIWRKPAAAQFNTAEFQAVYKSINWNMVPNIPPNKMDASGRFIQNYSAAIDPNCWWSASNCVTPKAPGINPDTYICQEPNTFGLTYDDGPNCTHNALYDFLKAQGQTATMFYIGSNVADWPKEAQRGLADGHQICVHTWSHPYMTTLTNEEVLGELYYTRKAIKYVVGVTPLCWRPPFGDVDDRVRAIAQQLNLTNIIWDQDTDDWQMIPAGSKPPSFVDEMYQTFVDRGLNGTYNTHGSIVLSHELNSATMDEAIKWLPKIKQAYKYVVPVAICMNTTQPYAEPDVKFPAFNQIASGTPTILPSTASAGTGTTAIGGALVTSSATRSISSVGTTICVVMTLVIISSMM